MIRILLISGLTLLSSITYGADTNHAIAKARKGENVEKLLKRYLLTPHYCNIESFYDINKIKTSKI